MKEFHRRLQKLETQVGHDNIEGARALVSLGRDVGLIGPDEDTEKLVADFANQGLSLVAILKEIDGQTIGLPCEREDA